MYVVSNKKYYDKYDEIELFLSKVAMFSLKAKVLTNCLLRIDRSKQFFRFT